MKKMILIDPQVLESLKKRQNPMISSVEKQMDKALDTQGSVRDEVRNYNHYLTQHKIIEDKLKPATPAPASLDYEILESVPMYARKKTKLLLEKIKPKIAWDEKGRLIAGGLPQEGTHILDLINDALRARKSKTPPRGRDIFIQQLQEIGLPQEIIQNPAYQKQTYPPAAQAVQSDDEDDDDSFHDSSWTPY